MSSPSTLSSINAGREPRTKLSIRRIRRSELPADTVQLSRFLIGKVVVHELPAGRVSGRIVETEAYVGAHDLACHASKGRTRRTEVMFGPAGHAYVYLIYGMYPMFNIVASVPGDAQAVLIRAAEPLDGWDADLSGPGKLTRAFGITCTQNGVDLAGRELFLLEGTPPPTIAVTKRIGVDYAQEWSHAMLRFIDKNSRAVSKVRAVRSE